MKKRYIRVDQIKKKPEGSALTPQEKEARLYALAENLGVKIGEEKWTYHRK